MRILILRGDHETARIFLCDVRWPWRVSMAVTKERPRLRRTRLLVDPLTFSHIALMTARVMLSRFRKARFVCPMLLPFLKVHVAASVQHVGIGPRRRVRGQSIFCERGRARETTLSPASSRLLDMILWRLVWCHPVGLDHRTILLPLACFRCGADAEIEVRQPLMAKLGHPSPHAGCLLPGAKRKTSALSEYFAF